MGRRRHTAHWAPERPVTYRDAGPCDDCGKMRFESRKRAKEVIKSRHHNDSLMNAYRCGDYWHIGHQAPAIRRGDTSRRELYGE